MYDLAKMFLHCLNHWKLETPTLRKQSMSAEDISAYKVDGLFCGFVAVRFVPLEGCSLKNIYITSTGLCLVIEMA